MWNIVTAWLVFVIGLSLPDDIYGDPDFNFYDEFDDVSGSDIDKITSPAALILHINVYLDLGWLLHHKSYAEETARQTIAQGLKKFDTFVKEPWFIYGGPVTHLLLTYPPPAKE